MKYFCTVDLEPLQIRVEGMIMRGAAGGITTDGHGPYVEDVEISVWDSTLGKWQQLNALLGVKEIQEFSEMLLEDWRNQI